MSREPRASRSDFRIWGTFASRWADNDAYGHVNNTVYYQWFDSIVNLWLVENRLLDIDKGDPIAIVVETRCTYFEPIAFPDDVDVGMAVAEIGRSSIRYRIGVFGEDHGRAAAQGEFVHVVVDRASRRPVEIPETWRRKLKTAKIT